MLNKKIKAIKETVNGITFDSRLEALAYRYLCMEFGKGCISCHEAITYTTDSDLIPQLTHRIDFVIRDAYGTPLRYLEVKGNIDGNFQGKAEYLRTLMLLEKLRPWVFDRYTLWVGSGELAFSKATKILPYALTFPTNPRSIKADLMLR